MTYFDFELVNWVRTVLEGTTSEKDRELEAVVLILRYFDVVVEECRNDVILCHCACEVMRDREFLQSVNISA